ncbi:MAG: Lrp/AsnC family transcriptional regulator [Candidatus Bathyarchaeota archaeon]|nr:MAG: Lrp/AsnC family transcriptional regulator [Candidatus Bathyarchaeota archaeon]
MKSQKRLELLRQMLKNSKKSDRDIARHLGLSQATISRLRARLEKEGHIKTYTIIPDFVKLGYEIMAFTFIKMKAYPTFDETQRIVQQGKEWVGKHPNVIFASDGEGLGGKDVIMISFHQNYSRYADFMRSYAMDWGHIVADFESFLVSLGSGFKMKPLDLKYLADDK